MMRAPRPAVARPAPAWALGLTLALGMVLLSGCTSDAAEPGPGPISIMDAVRVAQPAAKGLAPSASLVAFEGHEGPPPSHLRGLAGDHMVRIDTSYDKQRGDGRAYVWVVLFATHDGGLIRTSVVTEPYSVEARWVETAGDARMQALWALNLGGRLVVDTPQAMEALRGHDAAINRYLKENTDANVVYTSEVAPSDISDSRDLAHRIDIGYSDWHSDDYAYYGLVSHFSGRVLASGDFERGQEQRTVILVDEEFTLNPLQPEAEDTLVLPGTVYDVHLELTLSGNGRFIVEVWKDNRTKIADYVGNVLNDERTYTKDLGALERGAYTLRAEAIGQVTFKIVVDGVVVV